MYPLVSIIIPCYNAEKWIAETLESALAQTWPNKEIVVVNDGSRDRTLEIAMGYEEKGVKVISQYNRGHCAASNRAFRESKGELIKFFDTDDVMNPENIELQVKKLSGDYDCIASSEWETFL
jgi:glycosyltransferase involved in cell wall biosynthesis